MSRRVAVANQKGGVGKTTTVVNLGAYLARLGRRVLLVDADPQANATASLGFERRALTASLYQVLLGELPLEEIALPTTLPGLALAPASVDLAGAEVELADVPGREARLRAALNAGAADYDLILIDCPPSLGLLTVNALAAANGVLVPVQCEYLALEGLGQLLHTVERIRAAANQGLSLDGLILTMHDGRTNLSQQVIAEVRRHFDRLALETVVPRSVRLSEAPSYGQPILVYAPTSPGALAYEALAGELLRRWQAPSWGPRPGDSLAAPPPQERSLAHLPAGGAAPGSTAAGQERRR